MTTCSNTRFDYNTAIDALHREAIARGAKADPGCDPNDPYAIALPHVLAHGIQDNGPHCNEANCKLAGVCSALFELLEHRREATSSTAQALLALYDLLDETQNTINALRQSVTTKGLIAARPLVDAWNTASRVGLPRRAGWVYGKLAVWARILDASDQLSDAVRELSEDIRAPILSPELLKLKAPGRSPDPLLTSVYQHLSHAGYTPRQAGALVPDGLGGDPTKRVRNRMRAADARWIVPAQRSSSSSGSVTRHI